MVAVDTYLPSARVFAFAAEVGLALSLFPEVAALFE
jgi:hypothetical protein